MRSKQNPIRPNLRPLVVAAAFALSITAVPGLAQSSSAATMPASHAAMFTGAGTALAISARGEAQRVPDIAKLSSGVVTQAADAEAAMQANAEQMTSVVAAIRKSGIAERDIQTSGVSLNPQYRYADDQPPSITGYEARNSVDITVRDIGDLGSIIRILTGVGANQINGPSFEVDDKESAYDEARRAAIDTARARATMYAETLDMKVLRIVSISEGSGGFGPPMPMMAMGRMEKSSADTPISPGENTLSVELDVVFELGGK